MTENSDRGPLPQNALLRDEKEGRLLKGSHDKATKPNTFGALFGFGLLSGNVNHPSHHHELIYSIYLRKTQES